MGLLTSFKQKRVTRKFAKHNLNILQNLPFDKLQTILQGLILQGWEVHPDYLDTSNENNDWECKLRKGTSVLDVTWSASNTESDNTKNTGSITGLERIIVGLGKEFDTPVSKTPVFE